jgi:hypothetical protein
MCPTLVLLGLEFIPTEFIFGILNGPFDKVASATALRQELQGGIGGLRHMIHPVVGDTIDDLGLAGGTAVRARFLRNTNFRLL